MPNLILKIVPLFAGLMISAISFSANAQHLKAIEEMERKNQACLDSGVDMLGCSRRFYFQMDSMLNVAYNALRASLPLEGKATLKREQVAWLKKRDAYFKKQNADYRKKLKSGEWGPDMYMIVYGLDADFVKDRAIILFKRVK